MTFRKRLSTRERAALIEREGFRCIYCPFPILPGRDRWEVAHKIPLAMGGQHNPGNLACAHWKCHRVHTAVADIPAIAKSRRIRWRHIDAKRSANPLPGGREDRLKKKLDGSVVVRATEEHA